MSPRPCRSVASSHLLTPAIQLFPRVLCFSCLVIGAMLCVTFALCETCPFLHLLRVHLCVLLFLSCCANTAAFAVPAGRSGAFVLGSDRCLAPAGADLDPGRVTGGRARGRILSAGGNPSQTLTSALPSCLRSF